MHTVCCRKSRSFPLFEAAQCPQWSKTTGQLQAINHSLEQLQQAAHRLTAYVHGFIYLSCNNQLTNNFRIHKHTLTMQRETCQHTSGSPQYFLPSYICIFIVCMHSLCSWFGYLCACVFRIYSECLSDGFLRMFLNSHAWISGLVKMQSLLKPAATVSSTEPHA